MDNKNYLRILTYLVIAYMLVAFTWWTILLFQKNQDAFKSKSDFMELVMYAEKKVLSSVYGLSIEAITKR